MLPKFEIKEHNHRFFVETDWQVAVSGLGLGVTNMLQVSTAGKLDIASAGWSTRKKAEAAMEQCKARLR